MRLVGSGAEEGRGRFFERSLLEERRTETREFSLGEELRGIKGRGKREEQVGRVLREPYRRFLLEELRQLRGGLLVLSRRMGHRILRRGHV